MVQKVNPPSLQEQLLYPDSDGKPLADNTIQLRLIFTIKGGLDALFKDRDDVFIAADLLWYPVPLTPEEIGAQKQPQRQAPDVMVIFGRPKGDRGSYMQWKEENISPQVVFEILSPGNRKKEMDNKFAFYQKYGVEEYYLYNPQKNQLQGWLKQGEELIEISQMEGWQSSHLGITFSTSEGDLALFHPSGEQFVDYVEMFEERDRALAERERERLEKEREKERANRAEAAIEEERQKNQQLREQLRQLGIDPDSFS
ncbi:MAG: Uma2 family endonuclease [Jaaginema sp. PMC 1079.18]|nr:Uma2 family endonuclease [Jaaginema sp. PMC 1080.18]MEC4851116.1 Uma2 family endonuclease [Jaaginema sp. PMC 1079.18]MEC4867370.1 Uma2 family endonuclease [Jaaginema sp. PMC 1078.18]